MAQFFIKRPIFAIVIALLISIAGALSMWQLPIDRYPQIAPPSVRVIAMYPGANSEVLGETVAQSIEKQIIGIDGFESMTSSSASNGLYMLSILFDTDTDSDLASVQTQNRVAQANAQLPDAVRQLGVSVLKSSGDFALAVTLYSPNGTYDPTFLKNYFSINYMDDLKSIDGVGNVQEFGSDYAMHIWLNPTRMAQYGLTANEIIGAVRSQNQQAAAGSIGLNPAPDSQQFQYAVTVQGRLIQPEEFAAIVVKTNPDGSLIRLGDVARVELGALNQDFIARSNGQPAVGMAFSLTSDANALETVGEIKEKLAQAAQSFPEDMEYRIALDNTEFISASLTSVLETFVEALLLVALIVFLFLQSWKATLIPMLAVPVSLLGTFVAFEVLGFTINTLTLFAMVLAIGLVVDDAIVVIEAVEFEMRYHKRSPREATQMAMKKVSGPVIGVAVVLCSVFVPVAFAGGIMGVLYKQFALTIAVSVAISAFIALTLTPALCATILSDPKEKTGEKNALERFFDRFNAAFDRLLVRYEHALERMIRVSGVMLASLVAIAGLAVFFFWRMPTAFVPLEDNGYFIASVNLPEGATGKRTDAVIQRFVQFIGEQPGVEATMGVTGFDILSGGPKQNSGLAFIKLQHWDQRTSPELSVNAVMRKAFAFGMQTPEARILALNPPPIPGLGATGGFSMYLENKIGDSNESMFAVGQQFLAAVNARPEIAQAYTTFRVDTPAYQFDIDRDKVHQAGVNISDVFTSLQMFYGGLQINDFETFGRNFKVVAQADQEFRMSPDANRDLQVRNWKGEMIPLSSFIVPKRTGSVAVMTRFNNYPAMKIGGAPAPGYSSGQALAALEEVAAEVLPQGYSYEFAEQSAQEKKAGNQMMYVMALGILFVFLALAALYESWKVPFAVLLSVPTGIFGAAFFGWLLNVNNDIYFQIGLLTIVGLAAKNAILIVEYGKIRVDKGMKLTRAAVEAAIIRLRPILMTSLAFIIGCLPLALSTGAGSVSRSEMGITVVFGMLTATLLGIFLIPILFYVVERTGGKKE